MKVNAVNNNCRMNFGSIKLADLNLQKVLLNSATINYPAELHKLEPDDFVNVVALQDRKPFDKLVGCIYEDFIEFFCGNMPKSSFFIVKEKQEPKALAICEVTSRDRGMSLDVITNLDMNSGVKGAGTSLIVNLVELAKKKCSERIFLCSLDDAVHFYEKLGFKKDREAYFDGSYQMLAENYDNFLNTFKPKYYVNK